MRLVNRVFLNILSTPSVGDYCVLRLFSHNLALKYFNSKTYYFFQLLSFMLEGDHVRLVAPSKKNLPTFTKWMNDPEIMQYLLVYRPISLGQEEEWYKSMLQQSDMIFFSILKKEAGKEDILIGNISITLDHRNRVGNLGIAIGEKAYWGKGYGSEALRLMIVYGFNTLNLQRLELEVFASNPRAHAVYLKVGFVEEGKRRDAYFINGQYYDAINLGLLKKEWQSLGN